MDDEPEPQGGSQYLLAYRLRQRIVYVNFRIRYYRRI